MQLQTHGPINQSLPLDGVNYHKTGTLTSYLDDKVAEVTMSELGIGKPIVEPGCECEMCQLLRRHDNWQFLLGYGLQSTTANLLPLLKRNAPWFLLFGADATALSLAELKLLFLRGVTLADNDENSFGELRLQYIGSETWLRYVSSPPDGVDRVCNAEVAVFLFRE